MIYVLVQYIYICVTIFKEIKL